MTLFDDACTRTTGTFHWLAAAWTSIMRAAAPPLRTYSCDSRMPRLPPVENSPHARLRLTLSPGVGYSMFTFDQSHSSSSATSCARPVIVPCPISERTTRMFDGVVGRDRDPDADLGRAVLRARDWRDRTGQAQAQREATA